MCLSMHLNRFLHLLFRSCRYFSNRLLLIYGCTSLSCCLHASMPDSSFFHILFRSWYFVGKSLSIFGCIFLSCCQRIFMPLNKFFHLLLCFYLCASLSCRL